MQLPGKLPENCGLEPVRGRSKLKDQSSKIKALLNQQQMPSRRLLECFSTGTGAGPQPSHPGRVLPAFGAVMAVDFACEISIPIPGPDSAMITLERLSGRERLLE
jgi:hypothetical protein